MSERASGSQGHAVLQPPAQKGTFIHGQRPLQELTASAHSPEQTHSETCGGNSALFLRFRAPRGTATATAAVPRPLQPFIEERNEQPVTRCSSYRPRSQAPAKPASISHLLSCSVKGNFISRAGLPFSLFYFSVSTARLQENSTTSSHYRASCELYI